MIQVGQKWGDLKPRIITALALITAFGFALISGGWTLTLLVAVACGLMVWELTSMIAGAQKRAAMVLGVATGVAIVSLHLPYGQFIAGGLVLALGAFWLKDGKLTFTLYGAVIIAAGISVIMTRSSFAQFVMWLACVVIITDIAGYFIGRWLGGPKLWPRVSPKKTWSGTIGGWVASALVGVAFASVLGNGVILGSVLISAAAQAGDICESAIKRRAGVKDSSALLPGHGGLLDRFDGMIAAMGVWLAVAPIIVNVPDWS